MMLTLTPAAATAVDMVLHQPGVPDGASVRLARATDGDGEPAIAISVVSGPEPDDQPIDAAGESELLVAGDVAELLDDRVLDAEFRDEDVAFMIIAQPLNGDRPPE